MNVIYESVSINKDNFYSVSLYHLPMRKQNFVHYHDVLELGICLDGHGQYITDNGSIDFEKGDTQFILPYNAHYNIPYDDNTSWFFINIDIMRMSSENITIAPIFVDGLIKKIHSENIYKSSSPISKEIKEISELIQSEKNDKDMIILKIMLLLKKLATESEDILTTKNKSTIPALHLVSSYIKEGRRPSIKDMADVCFMSESYFRKIFTTHMGESPKNYITRMQLQKASIILINDNIAITDVALLCGFDDFSTFFRSFKKFYGISPSAYRAEQKK